MVLVKRQKEWPSGWEGVLSQIRHKIMLGERIVFGTKKLMAEPRPSREFGIPDDIGDDHIQNNCLMPRCTGPGLKKMARVYFSSYQWLPFLFLNFSFFLQMTCLVFRHGLRSNLQITNYTAKDIYQLWFRPG